MKFTSLVKLPLILLLSISAFAQQPNYNPFPMLLNVGKISMGMNKLNGDGGLQSLFSWDLTGSNPQQSEIFYWPQDQWQSNMLYQIFNPLVLDNNGIIDENNAHQTMYSRGGALTNAGVTDWAMEIRRYRPPHITVDGIPLDPPYRWNVDPTLKCDIKLVFEDVLPQFGIRSHVEIYAFSNPIHGDYFIWKATHKFTGETKLPRQSTTSKDSLPDQTIGFWWPIAFSFGPTKAGEYATLGGFAFEGEDDLDSWFARKSELVTTQPRDSLYVAYYWDTKGASTVQYSNGSRDDTGDPDRLNGTLYSTQIPGFTLLHADRSASDASDDRTQPYAMPHATIVADLWGRRDAGLLQTYRGDDGRGRFPPDPITAGLSTIPQKGPMRFITTGPYTLTKNAAAGRFDSITFVYAVGVGGINPRLADSIGALWFSGQLSDSARNAWIMTGLDSLWKTLDRANWAWNRLSTGQPISSPPPPPDITVNSGPDKITVAWGYPDPTYYIDPATGVDDWDAWRVYRKQGAYLVNDPLDQQSHAKWDLVFETHDRSVTTFVDHTPQRGVDYYYAVTGVDNGTQNIYDVNPGQKLESSMYVTRSQIPATSYKPSLVTSTGQVRVVPNPASARAVGSLAFSGTPDRILFVNLPLKCKLRIFTETGDLVTTIDHYGTADHQWDQRTDNNQYVASGIYILAVTDAQDLNGQPLKDEFVKFVIVR